LSWQAAATPFVASLNRPGGNFTGSTILSPEVNSKQLEFLKQAVPSITQVGILVNPDNPVNTGPQLQTLETTAKFLKMVIYRFDARERNEFESAFMAMVNKRVDAVVITEDAVFIGNPKAIAKLALKNSLPSTGFTDFAQAGGLIGYSVNHPELFRRAAYFVNRVLKGAKPPVRGAGYEIRTGHQSLMSFVKHHVCNGPAPPRAPTWEL
jgi:putative ABC transport system substrate-binding protein